MIASGVGLDQCLLRRRFAFRACWSENGWLPKKRPPRIAYNARGAFGPTQDTSDLRLNSAQQPVGDSWVADRGIREGSSNSARTGSGSALGSQIEWSVTWSEDRATRRRDPSAVPGAKTGDGTPEHHRSGCPVSVLLSGIGADALNLGGPGGQSPPALASADELLVNVSCVVCVC